MVADEEGEHKILAGELLVVRAGCDDLCRFPFQALEAVPVRAFHLRYLRIEARDFGGELGRVNGERVRFLVDTGATAVALTPADAQRLGFKPADLHYGNQVVTAAGATRAASVKLNNVTVAGARLNDVDALVIEKGLDTSLLGMTYLGRLSGFEATRHAMVLNP